MKCLERLNKLLANFPICKKFIVISMLFLTPSSCGYRAGQGGMFHANRTISIPYAEGDEEGALTAALIKEVANSGRFSYRNRGGSLILKVKVINYKDTDIGFQYYRRRSGQFRSILIPDETRTTISTEVALVESVSGQMILGPVRIEADVVFDHDYYSTRNDVNVFSLGQLTDIDAASKAAMRPLYHRLARKIVDYLLTQG